MSQTSADQARIELRVQELRQLFNSLDPSPFYDKDLDDDAERFLIGWAERLPRGASLSLVIHLHGAMDDTLGPDGLAEAIQNHFRREAEKSAQDLRNKLSDGRISLAIGLLFLFSCVTVRELFVGHFDGAIHREIIEEGLLISGWVAMWRPIQTFLYEWWPIGRRRRLLLRLAGMPVELRHDPAADKGGDRRSGQ